MADQPAPAESAAGLSFQMGEALLRNGAEIFRVQETMERVAHAYGIEEYNVYVLSNAIFANAVENGRRVETKLKFIPGSSIHFGRIAGINQLSREIEGGSVSIPEACERLHAIVDIPTPIRRRWCWPAASAAPVSATCSAARCSTRSRPCSAALCCRSS